MKMKKMQKMNKHRLLPNVRQRLERRMEMLNTCEKDIDWIRRMFREYMKLESRFLEREKRSQIQIEPSKDDLTKEVEK